MYLVPLATVSQQLCQTCRSTFCRGARLCFRAFAASVCWTTERVGSECDDDDDNNNDNDSFSFSGAYLNL